MARRYLDPMNRFVVSGSDDGAISQWHLASLGVEPGVRRSNQHASLRRSLRRHWSITPPAGFVRLIPARSDIKVESQHLLPR